MLIKFISRSKPWSTVLAMGIQFGTPAFIFVLSPYFPGYLFLPRSEATDWKPESQRSQSDRQQEGFQWGKRAQINPEKGQVLNNILKKVNVTCPKSVKVLSTSCLILPAGIKAKPYWEKTKGKWRYRKLKKDI